MTYDIKVQGYHMNQLTTIEAPRDPAQLGYPPTLPVEVALKTAPLDVIRQEYGYSIEEWHELKHDPAFLTDLAAACEMVRKDGMSFKLKAKLQAEELLKTSWKLIHGDPSEVSAAVKADLIKATARWAGYDEKPGMGQGVGNALSIQINL